MFGSRGVHSEVVKRRRWILGTALAAAVAAGIYFGANRGPNLDARTREYASSLRLGDWGHIYDMAPVKERRLQPWGRDQFVVMMRALDTRGTFREDSVDIVPVETALTSVKSFQFLPGQGLRAPTTDDDWPVTVTFYRDVDDWCPTAFYLPLSIARLANKDKPAQAKALLLACRSANINRMVRFEGSLVFEIERIPSFLEGKIKWADLFHSGKADLVAQD